MGEINNDFVEVEQMEVARQNQEIQIEPSSEMTLDKAEEIVQSVYNEVDGGAKDSAEGQEVKSVVGTVIAVGEVVAGVAEAVKVINELVEHKDDIEEGIETVKDGVGGLIDMTKQGIIDLVIPVAEDISKMISFNEYDLDDGEVQEAVDAFVPDNWDTLDSDERMDAINDLENVLCDKLGIAEVPNISFYYGPEGDYGGYVREGNELSLNANTFDDPQELVNTIAHETWHAHQYDCAENPQGIGDQVIGFGLENYVSPYDDFFLYYVQQVEFDARAFGGKIEDMVGA